MDAEPVAGDQAGEQPADEGPDEPRQERLAPVAGAPAQDELGEPAGQEPESEDGEDQHGGGSLAESWTGAQRTARRPQAASSALPACRIWKAMMISENPRNRAMNPTQ